MFAERICYMFYGIGKSLCSFICWLQIYDFFATYVHLAGKKFHLKR
jgi:hypothetical protein